MSRVWDLCKVYENPNRMRMLEVLYRALDRGCNVGVMGEELGRGLGAAATSQYLRQFERLGVMRRQRSGRYVNYYDDMREASPEVREVAALVREAIRREGRYDDRGAFRTLMNPFRARVCHALLVNGPMSRVALCERFERELKHIDRELEFAVQAGLLATCESEEGLGGYRFTDSCDAIIHRIVELAA